MTMPDADRPRQRAATAWNRQLGKRLPGSTTSQPPSPQFFVGYVQVALRLLNAGMAEHQLDDADVDAVREESTRAFVPQVVPAQIDTVRVVLDSIARPLFRVWVRCRSRIA